VNKSKRNQSKRNQSKRNQYKKNSIQPRRHVSRHTLLHHVIGTKESAYLIATDAIVVSDTGVHGVE
jgi:hypothetical protein